MLLDKHLLTSKNSQKMLEILKIFLLFIVLIQVESNKQCNFNNSEECQNLDVHSLYKGQKELCDFCYILLPLTRHLIETHETDHFRKIAVEICKELKIADEVVCELAIKNYQV